MTVCQVAAPGPGPGVARAGSRGRAIMAGPRNTTSNFRVRATQAQAGPPPAVRAGHPDTRMLPPRPGNTQVLLVTYASTVPIPKAEYLPFVKNSLKLVVCACVLLVEVSAL